MENKAKKLLSALSKLKVDFSSLKVGSIKDLETNTFERARRKLGLEPKKVLPEDKQER